MFTNFFFDLRAARIPVTLREYLALMEAMAANVAGYSVDDFYHLSRTILVKDERNLDRFDVVFGRVFKGLETGAGEGGEDVAARDLPDEWLRKLAERYLTDEEKAQVQALGGWDKLMETLAQRLAEQRGRHQGGSKWVGTAGTSPFGAYGYNPEGVRIGQEGSRHRRAVKVWDRREFRNLDDTVELGTRNIKVALRRLRKFARTGAADVLDLPDTIRATAANAGHLDLKLRPERHNAVKVLLFLDVGGSMDDHIRLCEELFSAAKGEFKHLEYFYFHNCVYEGVWKDNRRRRTEQMSTYEVLRTYPADYKLVFVGDASMSPYEILQPGGAVEHWNQEAGQVWLRRLLDVYRRAIWLNPVVEQYWSYTTSIDMVRRLMDGRMYPLTLQGLEAGMRELSH
ncbi:MAG: VWA domain-containing protein [Azospirillaceae bacterium]|nr:VWA domain-containing protein [Azospirillaceae bacterium]